MGRVDRSVPSGFSSYSPCMRMPRSGFQNTNTMAATLWMFSMAAWPVTGRPDAVDELLRALRPLRRRSVTNAARSIVLQLHASARDR